MPRYPFTPELLDALPEELCELFRGLELQLLEEICSRLKIADQLNEVTVQDIRALRAHGIDLEDIKKAIRKYTNTGEDKINALLDDVVARNQAYYISMIDLAQVTAPERLIDQEDTYAIYEQTKGQYRNITQSMGFLVKQGRHKVMLPPAQAYQWALDSAELQIQSGAISYNQAIAVAVRQLADSGLCIAYDKDGNPIKNRVAYESKKTPGKQGRVDHLDVAVRRAVMTGVNQLNQKYREQSMDYLETDLVEVTAHLGARNVDGPNGWENHAAWQGKVYRWKRGGGGYTAPEPTPSAPIQTAAPTTPSTEPRRTAAVDVTQEYLDAATPGIGSVTYEDGYKTKNHQDEIKMAGWLRRTFGGDIKLLKESKEQGSKTPDFLWNGRDWELKGVTTLNSIDRAIREAAKQIQENPGGIILNLLDGAQTMESIENAILQRFRRINLSSLDVLISSDGDLKKILRLKK